MNDPLARLTAALADRYRIERELGEGGMATVYLAEDLKHKRKVAVKVLRPELAASLGPDRFVREIEIAAQLTHPHILPLHDSGGADGFLYYVMPYIEGESLRERLDREGKLSVEDTIRVTDHVASALNYAHERGVIHRDVKPENIMLAGDQAIVADFGIARAVEVAGGERLTGTGLAIGTPAYMSPEQAMGLEDVDGRSDVYSLGCVVYEMVGGRAPFEGTTPQALLAKHAADTVPGLRASDPAIPLFVERAVEKALAKQPAERFETPSAFAEALTTGTVVARVGPPRWPRRVVAGAVGVALVAAAAWWLAAGGPAIERLAVLPPLNTLNAPEQEHIIQGMHNALITELGQSGITIIGSVQSMMRYQNTQMTVREIADELGVNAVIEGSVFWVGDSVGIDARLVHGGTEESLWSHSYGGDVRDVLTLYRDLTRAIADEIQVVLTPQADARLAGVRPVDPEAYEAVLKGQFYAYGLTPHDLQTALDYFQRALEIDPEYALAYEGISRVWASRMQMGLVPHAEAYPRAKAAADTALALDSSLAEAHFMLAIVRAYDEWDWEGAEAAFQRAIALNPNLSEARVFYSHFLHFMRRPEEAWPQIERALELDPFHFFNQYVYGVHMMFARRYDDAIVQIRKVLATVPNFPMAHNGLWFVLHRTGMHEEAMVQAQKYFDVVGDREAGEAMDRGYVEGGYLEAVRRAAETLATRSRSTFVSPLDIAGLYARAGELDLALHWLERGLEERDPNMTLLSVGPEYDILRDDPRFQDLLRRMNLPGIE